MKILEAQSAALSNYEIYQHLVDTQARYRSGPVKRKMPSNLGTVVHEVLEYLRTPPGPLADQQHYARYGLEVVPRLLEALRAANLSNQLTKGELLSILNMRPSNGAVLDPAVEDMSTRFSPEEQERILEIVGDIMGRPAPAAEPEQLA